MLDDDDDRFLYGDSTDVEEPPKSPVATSVPQPIPLEQVEALANTQGVVAHLEAKVAVEANGSGQDSESQGSAEPQVNGEADVQGDEEDEEEPKQEEQEEQEEEEEEEEESDDDIEIITEAPSRSLDFRQRPSASRPSQSFSTPTRTQQPAPSLTTEYTPRERGSVAKLPATPQPVSASGGLASSQTPLSSAATQEPKSTAQTDGVDASKLPVATAPPSHPQLDLEAPGVLDGRSILEVDLNNLAEKNWRRPGADLSDWFNYGFDEISWEAYCYRRREVNEVANLLKANVLNFAGMPEEQVAALPAEVRTMIMALVASGGGNPAAMMPAPMNMNGPMMNPMMNMGPMMGPMMHDMGPAEMGMVGQGMGMGMGGGMGGQGMGGQGMGGQGMGGQGMGGQGMGGQGMGGQPMGGPGMGGQGMVGAGMNDGALSGGVVIGSAGPVQGQGRATPDVPMSMLGDSFQGGPQGSGQTGMAMGMGGEFNLQEQQMYQGIEGNGGPAINTTPTRGGPPFRGRGIPQNTAIRGVRGGGFAGRGRGSQALPTRPASPLPPNVPTGPRNKNKYKDVDGSAPAVDGLDYGGGKERTTPPEYDDRGSRKRRSSPGLDDSRGPKRR